MDKIKKYIPNGITIIRLLLIPVFVIYLHDIVAYDCRSILSLLVFVIIIGSDLLDGALARILQATSKTGAKLDVASLNMLIVQFGMSVVVVLFLISFVKRMIYIQKVI